MYIVVAEDIDSGIWWGDPTGWDSLEECREQIKNAKELPKGYEYSIYDCRLVE